MGELTPMMVHYKKTKEEYSDCILFYRLGDFYEMFFDDAIVASRELEITLTGKDCGLEERAPMCGIPYHAYEGYLNRLVSRGYKVAICEQVEDPKLAKGIVKREVIRIVTPGTNMNGEALDAARNNYIMSIMYTEEGIGITTADISTGDFYATQADSIRTLNDEIIKFAPVEIICNEAFLMSGVNVTDLKERLGITLNALDNSYFDENKCIDSLSKQFLQLKNSDSCADETISEQVCHDEKSELKQVDINNSDCNNRTAANLESFGLKDMICAVISSGALLTYFFETQKTALTHITEIKVYNSGKYMVLDGATRRNLELTETMREKRKTGSLLGVLDKTRTAMGARTLRNYIEQPLVNMHDITDRQKAVSELKSEMVSREEIREYLAPVYDLERLIGRITYESANARDMLAFGSSLKMLPPIKYVLGSFKAPLLQELYESMDPLEDVSGMIEEMIDPDAPVTIKEGGIIRKGFDPDVDRLRDIGSNSKQYLAELEAAERESTGIKNLKIKYNKVFGYYIEVTNSYKDLVPDRYIRKQTLTNAERYIIPELKELEDNILGAQDKLFALEYELFTGLRKACASEVERIHKSAKAVAVLDVLTSLAYVAEKNHYVCPVMNENGIIRIKDGRHPVVEKVIKDGMFIPNDTYLDNDASRLSIITGPNMAGKSTYMRQTALIVLMAHIGSYVPASSAEISIVDRIFTRVGASDDLSTGQSTFMVEMTEVSNIVRNATARSLIILDEIGRGTSTYDGLSIAWSVIEYIADKKKIGAKTLFATHYHELTELEGKINGVNNYCIAVKEQGDSIVFLRKIIKGGADKSYGIQVASLAGVPDAITIRAGEILESLSDTDITRDVQMLLDRDSDKSRKKPVKKFDEVDIGQMSLMDTLSDEDVLKELKEMEISVLTPIEALNTLDRLQKKLNNRW